MTDKETDEMITRIAEDIKQNHPELLSLLREKIAPVLLNWDSGYASILATRDLVNAVRNGTWMPKASLSPND